MKTHKVFVSGMILFSIILASCGAEGLPPIGLSSDELTGTFEAKVAGAVATRNVDATALAEAAAEIVQTAIALTAAADGEVVAPTQDSDDTQQTATQVVATTATNTPLPTATNTLEPTETPILNDPAKTLGDPDFLDAFDNADNWSEYDSAGSKAVIKDGKLEFTRKVIPGGSQWTVSWREIENYYLQVTAETQDACSGYDRYGIIFRAPDPGQGLLLMVSCNGQYRVAKWDGSEMTFLVEWTPSEEIVTGANVTNRIGVLVQGETIKIYINGTEVDSIEDTDYVGKYRFGLLVGATETEPLIVKFDNLAYWTLP